MPRRYLAILLVLVVCGCAMSAHAQQQPSVVRLTPIPLSPYDTADRRLAEELRRGIASRNGSIMTAPQRDLDANLMHETPPSWSADDLRALARLFQSHVFVGVHRDPRMRDSVFVIIGQTRGTLRTDTIRVALANWPMPLADQLVIRAEEVSRMPIPEPSCVAGSIYFEFQLRDPHSFPLGPDSTRVRPVDENRAEGAEPMLVQFVVDTLGRLGSCNAQGPQGEMHAWFPNSRRRCGFGIGVRREFARTVSQSQIVQTAIAFK